MSDSDSRTSLPVPAPERGVEPSDALTHYMAQLRHHPPISREDEHALAVRWVEEGDVEAARENMMDHVEHWIT